MTTTPDFDGLLALIEQRSAALRAAASAAPSLDVRVPSCPDWSLGELVDHVAGVHRAWASIVTAGAADRPQVPDVQRPAGADPLSWSAAATDLLLCSLRAVGPEAPCWAWWAPEAAPRTAGAVARHQVQEAAVHAVDAQLAAGKPEPVPTAVAAEGLLELAEVGYRSCGPWPHGAAARVALLPVDAAGVLVTLTPGAAAVVGVVPAGAVGVEAELTVRGTASEVQLALHGRSPVEALTLEGDAELFTLLREWPPKG